MPSIHAFDDPSAARDWLTSAPRAPLSRIHELVMHARESERAEAGLSSAADWLVTRAAAHVALARRGSRVALYDLRESFDAAAVPLPVDFLVAAGLVGDETCLEPLARAWAAAPNEAWWRDRLRDAAADIVKREKLTGRSGAVRRIREKWTGFL